MLRLKHILGKVAALSLFAAGALPAALVAAPAVFFAAPVQDAAAQRLHYRYPGKPIIQTYSAVGGTYYQAWPPAIKRNNELLNACFGHRPLYCDKWVGPVRTTRNNFGPQHDADFVRFSDIADEWEGLKYPYFFFRSGPYHGPNIPDRVASDSIYLGGIISGNPIIDGQIRAVSHGQQFRVNTSQMRNVIDIAPHTNELNYQWQYRSGSEPWRNYPNHLYGARGPEVRYDTTIFRHHRNRRLRVRVSDASDSRQRQSITRNWDTRWVEFPHEVPVFHLEIDSAGKQIRTVNRELYGGDGGKYAAFVAERNDYRASQDPQSWQNYAGRVVRNLSPNQDYAPFSALQAAWDFDRPYLYFGSRITPAEGPAIFFTNLHHSYDQTERMYVGGIVSGDPAIIPPEFATLGAVYEADLSSMRNVLDIVPDPKELVLQWSIRYDGAQWRDLPGESGRTFTLKAGMFPPGATGRQIRLWVDDRSRLNNKRPAAAQWRPRIAGTESAQPPTGAQGGYIALYEARLFNIPASVVVVQFNRLDDVNGNPVRGEDMTVQWQTGDPNTGNWSNVTITPANPDQGAVANPAEEYILGAYYNYFIPNPADLGDDRQYIRVIASNRSGFPAGNATLTSAPLRFHQDPVVREGATLQILPYGSLNLTEGAEFWTNAPEVIRSKNVRQYRLEDFSYEWFAVGNGETTPIDQEEEVDANDPNAAPVEVDVYRFRYSDFAGIDNPTLEVRVSVQYSDFFGFTHNGVFTVTRAFSYGQIPARGEPRIVAPGDSPADGAVYTLDVDGISDANGFSAMWYDWYAANAGNARISLGSVNVGNDWTYTLKSTVGGGAGWNTEHTGLFAEITHVDSLQNTTTLTTAVYPIARETDSAAARIYTPDILADAVTVFVDLESVTDANNGEASGATILGYSWYGGGSTVVSGGVTGASYTLTETDITAAFANRPVSVLVEYKDGLGFLTTLTLAFEQENRLEDEQVAEQVGAVFSALEGQSAQGAIGGHLNAPEGGGGGGAATFIEVNGVRLHNKAELARALESGGENGFGDLPFGLDSFAMRRYGSHNADGKAQWSAWLLGSNTWLEGEPMVNGEMFKYEGNSFGIYGGYDRQVGAARIGLAVGRSDTELDVDLNSAADVTIGMTMTVKGSNKADDKVSRELYALMPYAEWDEDEWNLRLIGGLGTGEMEITYNREISDTAGTEKCTADASWNYLAAIGEYRVWQAGDWDASVNGNLSRSSSSNDAPTCLSGGVERNLPESKGSSGEFLLGGRGTYNGIANLTPEFGFDARRAFGDLKDDLAFEFAGNLQYNAGHLQFSLDGKKQLNKTDHNRDSISGGARYSAGAVHSSLQTEANAENGKRATLTHRWKLGAAGVWGVNTLGGNVYLESNHPAGGDSNLGAGVELRFGF